MKVKTTRTIKLSIELCGGAVRLRIQGSDFYGKAGRVYNCEEDAEKWYRSISKSPLRMLRTLVRGPWKKRESIKRS